jgi:hypothetical protein
VGGAGGWTRGVGPDNRAGDKRILSRTETIRPAMSRPAMMPLLEKTLLLCRPTGHRARHGARGHRSPVQGVRRDCRDHKVELQKRRALSGDHHKTAAVQTSACRMETNLSSEVSASWRPSRCQALPDRCSLVSQVTCIRLCPKSQVPSDTHSSRPKITPLRRSGEGQQNTGEN